MKFEILAKKLNIDMAEFVKWQNQQNPEDVISLEELEMMDYEVNCTQDKPVSILINMSQFLCETQKLDKKSVKELILQELIQLSWPVNQCFGYYMKTDMDDCLDNKVEFPLGYPNFLQYLTDYQKKDLRISLVLFKDFEYIVERYTPAIRFNLCYACNCFLTENMQIIQTKFDQLYYNPDETIGSDFCKHIQDLGNQIDQMRSIKAQNYQQLVQLNAQGIILSSNIE